MTRPHPVNRLDPIVHAFAFCPRCRGAMQLVPESGKQRPICSQCGFVQYLSPAPGAAVIVFRGDRVCLVRRKFAPKQGEWTLPAGFQEYNEDTENTARREVMEETGLKVRLTGLFGVHTGVLPPDRSVTVVVYRAEEIGGELEAGDDAAEVGFFDLDDLPGPIAFAIHRIVLDDLRAQRGLPPLWNLRQRALELESEAAGEQDGKQDGATS
jgi:8-oxo-dGTP diphosphatase